MESNRYVRWFQDIHLADVPQVGGKGASLGELYRDLRPLGIDVPNGFAIVVDAYRAVLAEGHLAEYLLDLLASLPPGDERTLTERAAAARQAILAQPLPASIESEITSAYRALSRAYGEEDTDVAVRSSATAEDLPEASFAGQQESYLNVRGAPALVEACRKCFASLFTARAISYRERFGFDHEKVGLSVCVQKMVRSDLGSSGVMFTIDTETGFPDLVLINSSYGLGEAIVQGTVNPDEFYVFKPTLAAGFRPILRRKIGSKEVKFIYDDDGEKRIRLQPVTPDERARWSLGDEDVLTLARWGVEIEGYYSRKRGLPTPMDLEWARDGRNGKLYIVQARPETVQSRRPPNRLTAYHLAGTGPVLLTGKTVGNQIEQGRVRVLKDPGEQSLLLPGEILVADKTDPDWEPAMKRARAVVTNRGGRTCHAAIVSRELGIPAVIGTENATEVLRDGQEVTISCAEGDQGKVYAGLIPFTISQVDKSEVPRLRTKVQVNVADPSQAFSLGQLPTDGVGLARMEFIVSNHLRLHPVAAARFAQLDGFRKEEIARLAAPYADPAEYFVARLSEGIGQICAAFYPKEVIVRLSDFKTNEYSHLLGGDLYEPKEENPMLGFRGASRYYHPLYRDGFALECRALRAVRDEMGLRNLKVMVPFCRTPAEGRLVVEELAARGLKRGENGLEVYVMCEIPSNVLLAEDFAEIFDGFSIGSNDLTQLVLGVDRESHLVAPLFDERNPAVLALIRQVIRVARNRGKKIGICGQAPSDYPEFARFLVQEGIDSISLNADAILKTLETIQEAEQAPRLSGVA